MQEEKNYAIIVWLWVGELEIYNVRKWLWMDNVRTWIRILIFVHMDNDFEWVNLKYIMWENLLGVKIWSSTGFFMMLLKLRIDDFGVSCWENLVLILSCFLQSFSICQISNLMLCLLYTIKQCKGRFCFLPFV